MRADVHSRRTRIADRLLSEGRIDAEGHEAAVAHMARSGDRIEEALLLVAAIGEAELLKWLAAGYGTRFVSTERLARADIDAAVRQKVPPGLARQRQVLPVSFDAKQGILTVVTANPADAAMLDELKSAPGVAGVQALVARPAAVAAAIDLVYFGDRSSFERLELRSREAYSVAVNLKGGHLLTEQQMAATRDAGARPRPPSNPDDLAISDSTIPGQREPSRVTTTPKPPPEDFLEALNLMVSLLENGRTGLRGHSSYVARLARKVAEKVGMPWDDVRAIVIGALVHDLGKHGTYHLTALNVAEYDTHRLLAQKTYTMPRRMFEHVRLPPLAMSSVESMYERFDGKGLPGREAGNRIPPGARLLALCDSFADLTQNPHNPFRRVLSATEACETLTKYQGSLFDPSVLRVFRSTVLGDQVRTKILSEHQVALLVDPSPEETTLLELSMAEHGFDIRIARTSLQAMKILAAGDVALVVSEMDLEPEDGLNLLAKAREQPWGESLPWMIMSRRHDPQHVQRGFELGIFDWVQKPATTALLMPKLKAAVERSRMQKPQKGVAGSLTEIALPDLVQLLWHGRKSGALRLRSGAEKGEIHFSEGRVVDATFRAHRGDAAFFALLAVTSGEFELDPAFRAGAATISASPEALLLEGMRRLDEAARK